MTDNAHADCFTFLQIMAKSNTPLTQMALYFEFPESLTVEQFIARLSDHVDTQPPAKRHSVKTYYDSFDWRLYSSGLLCDVTRSKTVSTFSLRHLDNDNMIISTELDDVPAFCNQFESEKIRGILEPILEMRSLLSLCSFDYDIHAVNIVNHDNKIVLRLLIEAHEHFNNRLAAQVIKGYDKIAAHIFDLFTTKLGLTPSDRSLLLPALKLQGRKPKDYTSKLAIHLDPTMRADIAGKYIFSHLLKTIKDNEQGVIHNTDSEFLHDFRVAVRKTRAGLSQIKGVLPEVTGAYYADFFSWLGQVTGPMRDLDVYLLNFADYKNSLPVSIRADLDPLHDFLLIKQQKAQKELAKKLRSAKYSSTMAEWERYLKEEAPKTPLEANAKLTIKQLADWRIWKVYNRVLQEGDAITEQSESEILHCLRKTCKKLRYLIEFFQNLYPENMIKPLIGHLKELQEVLGEFQDYQVQESHLKRFSEEMAAHHIPAETLSAIDTLIQNMDLNSRKARHDFSEKYAAFKQANNVSAFKTLFAR